MDNTISEIPPTAVPLFTESECNEASKRSTSRCGWIQAIEGSCVESVEAEKSRCKS